MQYMPRQDEKVKLMRDSIQREFKFERPVSSRELYGMLGNIADTANSRWQIYFHRTVAYDATLEFRGPDIIVEDAKGYIERSKLQLDLSAEAERFLDALPPDPLENYFNGLTLNETFGWRGGSPSTQDRTELSRYLDEIAAALVRYPVFRITEANKQLAD